MIVARSIWLLSLVATVPLMGSDEASAQSTIREVVHLVGVTAPSREVTLASVLPARVLALPAREGSFVKAGDEIIVLDDRVQRAHTEMAQASAKSTLKIQLTRVLRDNAQREWKRLESLGGQDAASIKELSDTESLAAAAGLEHDIALFDHAQAQRNYERERQLLKEFQLRAPFAGYVSRQHKESRAMRWHLYRCMSTVCRLRF